MLPTFRPSNEEAKQPIPYPSCLSPSCLQKEAQEYLTTCSCPDYLVKAEKRLTEEIERVKHYLDPTTEAKITRAVEIELIQNQV